jgi:hypothetical protein
MDLGKGNMARKSPSISVPSLPDEARILSFNVGHGDCTLIEYASEGNISFRMLVDAGAKLPAALTDHLKTFPRSEGEKDIDVVVLTHVDHDHQGGLPQLLKEGFSIGEYFGPCLPTFRRLSWLFAKGVADAVERAKEWENALKESKIPITYPLDGYSQRFLGGRVIVSVISPAARTLERLSLASGADLAGLLDRHPMPLQWLLEDDLESKQDDFDRIRQAFRGKSTVTPAELDGLLPDANLDQDSLMQVAETINGADFEPELFGNSVLNDTSLVVVVDMFLDNVNRKRILLTGDQENWSYIAACNPTGLGADVLKAPHHGGRVYFDDFHEAIEQFYLWARPRTVLVSASGRHDLPRLLVREAIRKIGASLICPCSRNIEMLTAGTPEGGWKSCYMAYNCRPAVDQRVSKMVLKARYESVNVATCVQGLGHSGTAPIVVMQQSVVVPSEAFVRWTRGQLEKHSQWILSKLSRRQEEFIQHANGSPIDIALQQPVRLSTILSLAKAAGRHDLAADPEPVLKFARSQHTFWVNMDRYDSLFMELYKYPNQKDLQLCNQLLTKIPHIFVRCQLSNDDVVNCDRIAILHGADWTALEYMLASKLGVPVELASSEVLPALLPLISESFGLQICSLDNAGRNFDGGNAILWLSKIKGSRTLPDLEFLASSTPYGKDKLFLGEVFKQARSNVLVAISIQRNNNRNGNKEDMRNWSTYMAWKDAFKATSAQCRFKEEDSLSIRMMSACWTTVW